MIGYIYKITSPSGKIYIGSTLNIRKRFSYYKNVTCKKQIRLFNSLKKYGYDNHRFEILQECFDDEMLKLEALYGCVFDVLGENGLNLCLPNIGDIYKRAGDEYRDKLSKANKGQIPYMKGKNHRPDTIELMKRFTGSDRYNSKLVLNTETGIFYDCLKEAADSCNKRVNYIWGNIVENRINRTPFIYA